MPDNGIHTFVGAGAGLFTALYRARTQEPLHQLAEGVGGGLAGCLGGKLPDIIEPPTSSWHRGPFHSVAALGLLSSSFPRLEAWEQWCRENAEHHRNVRMAPNVDPFSQFLHFLAEAVWRILAGIPAGFVAAYISHLLMDGVSARSIPLIA